MALPTNVKYYLMSAGALILAIGSAALPIVLQWLFYAFGLAFIVLLLLGLHEDNVF